jgi:hypothetical protein
VGPEVTVQTLVVAAYTLPCAAEAEEARCLSVREASREEFRLWYAPIEGYAHVEGVATRLEVVRRPVPIVEDGVSFAYRLRRVLSAVRIGSDAPTSPSDR